MTTHSMSPLSTADGQPRRCTVHERPSQKRHCRGIDARYGPTPARLLHQSFLGIAFDNDRRNDETSFLQLLRSIISNVPQPKMLVLVDLFVEPLANRNSFGILGNQNFVH